MQRMREGDAKIRVRDTKDGKRRCNRQEEVMPEWEEEINLYLKNSSFLNGRHFD